MRRCFCPEDRRPAQGEECPTCSKPDYSKMRPSAGEADRHKRVEARLLLGRIRTERL